MLKQHRRIFSRLLRAKQVGRNIDIAILILNLLHHDIMVLRNLELAVVPPVIIPPGFFLILRVNDGYPWLMGRVQGMTGNQQRD
jgi:hypothetical protein